MREAGGTVNWTHYLNARTHESVINVIFVSFLSQKGEKREEKRELFPVYAFSPCAPLWVRKCLLQLVSVCFLCSRQTASQRKVESKQMLSLRVQNLQKAFAAGSWVALTRQNVLKYFN
jgi:hypothetical protein